MENHTYTTCPDCECRIREDRLARHYAKVHSPEAVEKKQKKEAQLAAQQQLRKTEGEKIVSCSRCGIQIKKKNLSKHLIKQHGVSAGAGLSNTSSTSSIPRYSVCGRPAIPGDNLCSTHSKQ